MHRNNVPMGLATSSTKDGYELKVNKHHQELFSLFPYKTMGSSDPEVVRGKPYPDIFLVAASRFPDKPKAEQVCYCTHIQQDTSDWCILVCVMHKNTMLKVLCK